MAVTGACEVGLLELVKLFYDDGLYGNAGQEAIEFAAAGGQLKTMEFFLENKCVDPASLDSSFIMAAAFGKIQAVEYIFCIDGFKTSIASIESALSQAAGAGYVEVVRFLNIKEKLSTELVPKAFRTAATNLGDTFEVVRDQVGVLECLLTTGCITSSFTSSLFAAAARRSCVGVVRFLYEKGSIPPGMVNTAFGFSARQNGGDVVSFLAKTGDIPASFISGDFGVAISDGDVYFVECMFKSGFFSREELKRESRGERVGNIRIDRFFRQNLSRYYPGIAVSKCNNKVNKTDEDAAWDFHRLKCLETDWLPYKIQDLRHVVKSIDSFAMPVGMAAMEAAATGQVEWLHRLLPQLRAKIRHMVSKLTAVAAAHDHAEMVENFWREGRNKL